MLVANFMFGIVPETEYAALCVIPWSIAEIIRYSYYIAKESDHEIRILTWLRYSAFIILYPFGVTGELLTIWQALPLIRKQKILRYPMPNTYNFSFDLPSTLYIYLLLYFPFFIQIYTYMLSQ